MQPAVDLLGRVARGLGAGLMTGLALLALVGFGVRTIQWLQPAAPPELATPAGALLVGGTVAAAGAAAVVTWTLLGPIGNPWRQGMFALLAAFGSFALSLVAIPVDRHFGRLGLVLLALVAGVIAWRLARRLVAPGAGGGGGGGQRA
jgi:hypothetical protein